MDRVVESILKISSIFDDIYFKNLWKKKLKYGEGQIEFGALLSKIQVSSFNTTVSEFAPSKL
jgi:hypothetical protein